jgi:hypothetical protein
MLNLKDRSHAGENVPACIKLDAPEIKLGRSTNNPSSSFIQLDDPFSKSMTSRMHATMALKDSCWSIVDHSVNGVLVNSHRIPKEVPYCLFDGDEITFGTPRSILIYTLLNWPESGSASNGNNIISSNANTNSLVPLSSGSSSPRGEPITVAPKVPAAQDGVSIILNEISALEEIHPETSIFFQSNIAASDARSIPSHATGAQTPSTSSMHKNFFSDLKWPLSDEEGNHFPALTPTGQGMPTETVMAANLVPVVDSKQNLKPSEEKNSKNVSKKRNLDAISKHFPRSIRGKKEARPGIKGNYKSELKNHDNSRPQTTAISIPTTLTSSDVNITQSRRKSPPLATPRVRLPTGNDADRQIHSPHPNRPSAVSSSSSSLSSSCADPPTLVKAEIRTRADEKNDEKNEVPNVLHERSCSGLTKLRARLSQLSDEVVCCICHDLMIGAHALPCAHTFCGACIKAWLTQQSTCPQCRAKVAFATSISILP